MPFYNQDLRAFNAIYAPDFVLTEQSKDFFTYPYKGFVWAETAEEAGALHGLTEEDTQAAILKITTPPPLPRRQQSRRSQQTRQGT